MPLSCHACSPTRSSRLRMGLHTTSNVSHADIERSHDCRRAFANCGHFSTTHWTLSCSASPVLRFPSGLLTVSSRSFGCYLAVSSPRLRPLNELAHGAVSSLCVTFTWARIGSDVTRCAYVKRREPARHVRCVKRIKVASYVFVLHRILTCRQG